MRISARRCIAATETVVLFPTLTGESPALLGDGIMLRLVLLLLLLLLVGPSPHQSRRKSERAALSWAPVKDEPKTSFVAWAEPAPAKNEEAKKEESSASG